jgi:hypothetical protein
VCGRSILEEVVSRTDVWANSADKTYKFSQQHISNWMYPVSFGYFPDGFYGCLRGTWGQPCQGTEVDSWVAPPSGGAAGCDKTKDCQHPLFYSGSKGDESLEVQEYEQQFEYPVEFWYKNLYSVVLTITDTKTPEIFYFCYVHNYMGGKIIVANADGSTRGKLPYQKWDLHPLAPTNDNEKKCGYSSAPMYGDKSGPLANGQCAQKSTCGMRDDFADCMDAINCAMTHNMRVKHSGDAVVTFMRYL